MKSNTSVFKTNTSSNYVSMVDDYRRTKHFYFKKTLSGDLDLVFNKLCESFQKSFHLSKAIEQGVSFNLKVNGLSTKHVFSEFSLEDKYVQIEWVIGLDFYWLDFFVKRKWFNKKKSILKIKATITKDKTFFGIQDFIGVYIYRKGFKKNCKSIYQAVKTLISLDNENKDNL